jgi:hypothetical protein
MRSPGTMGAAASERGAAFRFGGVDRAWHPGFGVAFPTEVVMLPSFSRGLRLALVLALSVGYVTWTGHGHSAYAKPDDDDDGDDAADSGKDSGDGEDTGEDDKDQPPVTAGGLFTMKTYPVNELLRPLTITRGISQARLGLGTDISDKGAFSSGGLSLDAEYGVSDNFMVIGGVTDAYNFKQFSVYAGFEGAISYDLLDVRIAANFHRSAVALLCTNDPNLPSACMADMDNAQLPIPSGNYETGKTQFSIDLGFPFRYTIKPEIAIVALQTLMSIDFDSKPDLNPSVGIATNPIPELSVVALAQLRIPNFDTSAGSLQVPLTARVEFSPNRQFDIGLEFTLLNVKPPDPQKPFDARFVSLFAQFRLGK